MHTRWLSKRNALAGAGLIATYAAAYGCDLPNGDQDLPDTAVAGQAPPASIALIVAPSDRTARGALPVTVEVKIFDNGILPDGGSACVSVTGKPGRLEFPFAADCASASADAASDGASDAVPPSDASPEAGAGALRDGGAPDFVPSTSCVTPNDNSPRYARVVAAYVLTGGESTASLFAALYASPTCTGTPIATNSSVVSLVSSPGSGDAASDAQDGAPAEAGGDAAIASDADRTGTGDTAGDAGADG